MKFIVINDKILEEDKALISVNQRGFRFGDGVFETCRVEDGVVYDWESHLRRLKMGLKAVRIEAKLDDLKNKVEQLIFKNSVNLGLVRIYVSRGIGSLGYFPTHKSPALIVIETMEAPELRYSNLELCLSSFTKPSLKSMPVNYKLAQGMNSTLVRMEAVDNGCFDAILLNDLGEICETSSTNIFWVKDDILYTPDEECGCVLGTIRQKIIDLSPVRIVKIKAKIDEILNADEVFLTNAALGIISVDQFQKQKFSSKKYFALFSDLLNKDIKNYVKVAKSA